MKRILIKNGMMHFIYHDDLRPLLSGKSTISRVSHVEPSGKLWTADLSPVGGPVLGPFESRSEALEAETSWLDRNKFGQIRS